MLANLSVREKTLLAVVLVILVGGGFYLWLYEPIQAEIRTLENEISIIERNISRARISSRQLPQLREEYQELERELERFQILIPTEEQVSEFLRDLEGLARNLDLKLKTFRPGGMTPRDEYGEVAFRLNLSGRFQNVILFLTALEEFKRIVNIRDISMSGAEGEGRDWVELNINVITYVLFDEEGGS